MAIQSIARSLLATAAADLHFDRRRQGASCLLVATLPMTAQVHLALEGLITESASEGLVARVLAHVRDQVRALAEGFQADGAFVRLLTCNASK